MLIKLSNKSSVFGGQERYIRELGVWLLNQKSKVCFEGQPKLGLPTVPLGEAYDVHIYNGNSALYSTLKNGVSKAVNVYVHHSHINDGQQASWRRWLRKVLLKFLLRRFDLVVRVCNVALPDFYAPNKIVTIYNGVTVSPNVSPREPRQIKKWLMVGAVTANKNQRLAIDALAYCPEAFLTVVGAGPELESLKLYASSLEVDNRVNWAGFVADPMPYFEECDVLLMLSHFEAFPYVVLEAMACGMPVVAVPVGGVPEVIAQDNGVLLKDYAIDSLVDAIKRLNQSPNLYAQLSRAAIKTVGERFTAEICYSTLLAEIERLIKVKGR